MKIHSLFILKNTGVPIYYRNFTNKFKDYDVNLITPFFSAIFSFSETIIKRKLEELEMSGLRLTFKEENEFIFVLLSDSSVSILFTSTRLISIADALFREYYQLNKLRQFKQIENPKFDKQIDSIIKGEEDLLASRDFFDRVIGHFKNLLHQSEIIGAAILSTKGNIIYSSLPTELLLNSVRELEIRFMSGTLTLPEMFYSLENGEKVFSKIISEGVGVFQFFVVLLFEKEVPLGMCEVSLFKISNTVQKLLQDEIEMIPP
jgi:hypothetical protein